MDSIRIEIREIREGSKKFSFRVGPEEIGLEEEDTVFRASLDIDVEVVRSGGTVTLRGTALTVAERRCGRCLVSYREDVAAEFREALHLEGERLRVYDAEYEGEPGFLPGPAGAACLDEIVREAILVVAPMKPVCRPDCRGLCPVCGVDRNRETCDCRVEEPHPAW